jgi:hypothetical protein
MKRRGPGLPIVGNPVPHAGTVDPDQIDAIRRLDCRSYDRCLDVADEQGWPGFQCNECRGFEPPTAEEKRHSYLGALRLLAETQLLASLAADDVFVDESDDDVDGPTSEPLPSYDDEDLDDAYLDRVLPRRTDRTDN